MDKQNDDVWPWTSRTRRQILASAARGAVGAGALSTLGLPSIHAATLADKRVHGAQSLTLPSSQHPTPADFYVAPGGVDTNPGTAAAPFATGKSARRCAQEDRSRSPIRRSGSLAWRRLQTVTDTPVRPAGRAQWPVFGDLCSVPR